MLPISSVYLTLVERIPLSVCCIGGLAIVVNFVQCSSGCSSCPWEANLSYRSARIVKLNLDMLLLAIDRYKPDVLFLNGGDFWRFGHAKEILSSVSPLEILKGAKIILCPSTVQDLQQIYETIKLCDIVLVEVCECTDVALFLDVLRIAVKDKHTEIAVVWDTNNIKDKLKNIIDELIKLDIYIPINIVLQQYEEASIYQFIDSVKMSYPLIHTMYAPSSEYSSILCPRCRTPVVVRHGIQVLKISIDENCRCIYCNHKVVSTGKSFCRSRKVVKIPINILLV